MKINLFTHADFMVNKTPFCGHIDDTGYLCGRDELSHIDKNHEFIKFGEKIK